MALSRGFLNTWEWPWGMMLHVERFMYGYMYMINYAITSILDLFTL